MRKVVTVLFLVVVLSVTCCRANEDSTQQNAQKSQPDWVKEREERLKQRLGEHFPRPDIRNVDPSERLSPEQLREMYMKRRDSYDRFPSHHDIPNLKRDIDRDIRPPEHPDFSKMAPEEIREYFLKRRFNGPTGGSDIRPNFGHSEDPIPRTAGDTGRMADAMAGRPASPEGGLFRPDEHLRHRLLQIEDEMKVLKELLKTADLFDSNSASGRPLFEEQIARAKRLHPDLAESIDKVFGRFMTTSSKTEDRPEQPKAEEAHDQPPSS